MSKTVRLLTVSLFPPLRSHSTPWAIHPAQEDKLKRNKIALAGIALLVAGGLALTAVSYTHLTLPTKRIV